MGRKREADDHVAQIDCRGRTVAEVVGPVLPWCRQAIELGGRPVVALHNLDLIADSPGMLLRALDRLAVDFGLRVALADRSSLTRAFLRAYHPPALPTHDQRVDRSTRLPQA